MHFNIDWRVPDKLNWRSILLKYKSAGLNTIRIYFHWAYHSPDEGVYNFKGNRDIDYLLDLCEELNLFVMAAPGPYICAETQAGGIPPWLVAKREVRIKHSVMQNFRWYDSEYQKYCTQYFEKICPIIAKHQITIKKFGCVIAFMIENENYEIENEIPTGLHDDMRMLAKAARDYGINVPLFTNDAWEAGSWITKPDDYRIYGKKPFGLDLYGFDKYVIWYPGWPEKGKSPEWDPSNVINALGWTEDRVRGYGGGAAQSPLLIPELQGGWFNNYMVKQTYDDIYTFYGHKYTRLIFETALSCHFTCFTAELIGEHLVTLMYILLTITLHQSVNSDTFRKEEESSV